MTEQFTIKLPDSQLQHAKLEADRLGVSIEDYPHQLMAEGLPSTATAARADVSMIIGIGSSAEPTDVGRDKQKMLGEAVWAEHLRKTGQRSGPS